MPRPVVEQKVTVSATPAPESRAPQLGVFAPMDVRAAPAGGGFQGLAQALGVLGNVGGTAMAQRADATAKADAAEGQADAELAQVDPERAAHTTAALARRDRWEKRKAAMTPEAIAAKAARDYVHWLRRQLRRAADAARWERLTVALEAYAWEREEAKRKADELRERVRDRTADTYKRAAAGCLACAAFIADESADELYREAFTAPAAPVRQ